MQNHAPNNVKSLKRLHLPCNKTQQKQKKLEKKTNRQPREIDTRNGPNTI